MGGGGKKQTNKMLDTAYNRNMSDANSLQNQWLKESNTARGRADDMYGVQYTGFKNFAEGNGTMDPAIRDALLKGGGGGGGPDMSGYNEVEGLYRNFLGGGGVDAGAVRAAQGAMREIAGSGGWDPARRANVDADIAKMRATADDATIANRFRGNGVYDELTRTGGYDDAAKSNIRARALSPVSAMYDQSRRDVGRAATIQGGGLNPALMARLARENARESGRVSLDAEIGIQDKVNQGRLAGAAGMSSAEGALQAMRLGALKGASDTESNMVNSIAQNRLRGSEGWSGSEMALQEAIQRGKMFGTQGLEGVAGARASASASRGAMNDANLRWLADFEAGNKLAGLEGMNSLYRSTPGEVSMYHDDLLKNRSERNSTAGGLLSERYANNKGFNWSGLLGGAANIGSAFLTGGASAAGKGLGIGTYLPPQ